MPPFFGRTFLRKTGTFRKHHGISSLLPTEPDTKKMSFVTLVLTLLGVISVFAHIEPSTFTPSLIPEPLRLYVRYLIDRSLKVFNHTTTLR